jgi:hypothetical protein
MSWSYSGDPTSSPKDEVRFLVGDTNTLDQQLQDAEIMYALTLVYPPPTPIPPNGNYIPAAYCCDALMSKYARMIDKGVGDLRISYSNRIKQYQELAARLRMRATLAHVPMFAGGTSIAQKIAAYSDPDRIQVAVPIDSMDYAGTQPGGENFGNPSNETTIP